MTSIFSLVLLFIAAYLGAQLFKMFPSRSLWMKGIGYSGSIYIVIGLLIGPRFLNIINIENLKQLDIIFALVLGWAGFLIGLQTDIKALKRFQKNHYWFALINFSISFVLSYIILFYAGRYVAPDIKYGDILILSLAGAVTSPILIAVITKEYKISGSISYLLRFAAAFDNMVGILALGLFVAFLSEARFLDDIVLSLEMTGIMILMALLFSFLYYKLAKELKSEEEDRLLVISLLLFLLGISMVFGQSLLFTAFIFGLGLANLKIKTKKLFLDIQNLEKPFYVLLLLYTGVSLNYKGIYYLVLMAAFILIHIMSKYSAGLVSRKVTNENIVFSSSIGLGNLGMGGLSLAIILDVHLLGTTQFTELLLFVVTISILVNDILSLWYLRRYTGKESKTI